MIFQNNKNLLVDKVSKCWGWKEGFRKDGCFHSSRQWKNGDAEIIQLGCSHTWTQNVYRRQKCQIEDYENDTEANRKDENGNVKKIREVPKIVSTENSLDSPDKTSSTFVSMVKWVSPATIVIEIRNTASQTHG